MLCVAPLEPLDEATGFLGRKVFVERGGLVGAEIVLHEHDLAGQQEMTVPVSSIRRLRNVRASALTMAGALLQPSDGLER